MIDATELALATTLGKRARRIEENTSKLISFRQEEARGLISDMRSHMDTHLEAVFGEHIADLLEGVEEAVSDRMVTLHDVNLFKYFYKRTLENFDKAHFYATSLSSHLYFWQDQRMEEAIRNFVDGGGKMTRIFILDSLDELKTTEASEVLAKQRAIGVRTFTLAGVPTRLQKLFVVDAKGRIAWEASVSAKGEILKVVATSDSERVAKYKRHFDQIKRLAGTRELLDQQ